MLGGWGLPVRNNQPAIPLETNFGWSQGFVDLARISSYDFGNCRNIEKSVANRSALLSFPGVFTYGHWIIDIAARLEVLRDHFDLAELDYILPEPLPSWAEPFLSAFGIDFNQIIRLRNNDVIWVDNLIVPTLMRMNDYLPDYPHCSSLHRLQRYGQARRYSHEKGRRLFVRHEPQTSAGTRPTLKLTAYVEDILKEANFTTIVPARMSMVNQIGLFGQAEIIVGEDSSALHNSVWATQELKTVVLSAPSRHNILHHSLAKLLGQKCRYLYGHKQTGSYFELDPAELRSTLLERG